MPPSQRLHATFSSPGGYGSPMTMINGVPGLSADIFRSASWSEAGGTAAAAGNGMRFSTAIESDNAAVRGAAIDVLAGLNSLGISPSLKGKVEEALQALQKAADEAISTTPELRAPLRVSLSGAPLVPTLVHTSVSRPGSGGLALASASAAAGTAPQQQQVEALEKKLNMSRSIMRKLYHKNVLLEKELALLKANGVPVMALDIVGGASSPPNRDTTTQRPASSGSPGIGGVTLGSLDPS
jgi:hypothetical protein